MTRIIDGDIWANPLVRRKANGASLRVYCIAYVTRYMPWMFRAGDVLVCDASRRAVAVGETNPSVLRKICRKGVAIFSREALHVKCAVFDDVSIVGSANLSESSAHVLTEVAVLREDGQQAARLKNFIDGIIESDATVLMDENELKKLEKIPRKSYTPWQNGYLGIRKRRSRRKADSVIRNWLMSVHTLKRQLPEAVEQHVQNQTDQLAAAQKKSLWRSNEIDWFQTTDRRILQRIRPNDSIIMIDHGESENPKRGVVYAPGIVLKVTRRQGRSFVHYTHGKKSVGLGSFRKDSNVRQAFPRGVADNPTRILTDAQYEMLAKAFKVRSYR